MFSYVNAVRADWCECICHYIRTHSFCDKMKEVRLGTNISVHFFTGGVNGAVSVAQFDRRCSKNRIHVCGKVGIVFRVVIRRCPRHPFV